jgi:signal transduction histidine kinase/ligand-binding sensor domain-containing protein
MQLTGKVVIRKTLRSRLPVWALFLFSLSSMAQVMPDDVPFEHVSVPGSIRSSYALDILQDPGGLLWFGTASGLFRFDGYSFTAFDYVEPDSVRMASRQITSLLWDEKGKRLLVGTRQHGLLMYSNERDRLVTLVRSKEAEINDLAQTRDGMIWAASGTAGLFRVGKDTLVYCDTHDSDPGVSALLAHENKIFVGGTQRISVMENGVFQYTMPLQKEGYTFAPKTRVTALMIDHRNRLWAGTDLEGVLVIDLATRKIVEHFTANEEPFTGRINGFMQDDQKLIWILTKTSGTVLYNSDTQEMVQLIRDPTNQYSISGNNCASIFQDRSGIIWIGSNGDLNKYDRDKRKFMHYEFNPHNPHSLSDNVIRGIYVDPTDHIWAASEGGYINIIDQATHKVQRVKITIPGLDDIVIPYAFAPKSETEIFVGSSAGLLLFNTRSQQISAYSPLAQYTDGKRVRQLLRSEQKLYALVAGNVLVYDLQKGEVEEWKDFGGRATFLYEDNEGRIWISTPDYLWHRDKGIGVLTRQQFSADTVRKMPLLIQQTGHSLIVTVYEAGMYILDVGADGRFAVRKHFTTRNGLPDNTVYAALEDKSGNLWLSSNQGIIRYANNDSTFTSFDTSEGVQDEEFNRLAFARTNGGKLVFGGINGLNVFDPERFSVERHTVTPVLFGLTTYTAESASNTRDYYTLFDRKELKLKHIQNFFTITFGTADFHTPVRHTYQYKLEHIDKNWIEAGQHNFANYTELEPGEYIFRVKVTGIGGTDTEASVKIYIIPPFYKTWWFNVLAFVAAGVIVLGVIQGRVQQDKLDRHRLEGLLTMRTAEIERSREELKALNQKKDLIFSILSHDLRSPLTTLKGFLGILIEDAGVLSREDIKKYALTIRNSVTNSLDLIDNTLFWSLSQMGNITYSPTRVSVDLVVEKIMGLYQLTVQKKKIELTYKADEALTVHVDENMFYVTLRNLVSNAIKYTPEGKTIRVTCIRKGNLAELVVHDEGVGMSAEYLSKVLSMKQPILKKGTLNEKGTGLGLLLCKEFIALNNGTFDVFSEEGVGTTIRAAFPLAEENAPQS